jgi:hypothetical protein
MVTVRDKIWKNKRVPDLEDLLVTRLAEASGREAWQEFGDLGTLLEATGDGAKPPACCRASWQLPGPAPYRQATTSYEHKNTVNYATVSPPIPLGARSHPGTAVRDGTGAVRGCIRV